MRKTAIEIQGFEYDWLACDAEGHVGLFATAGGSYAPAAFLQDTEAFEAAIQMILTLPILAEPVFAPALVPKSDNTWTEMALRGVFGFDGTPNGGPYEQLSVPARPIRLSDLPEPAANIVARIVLHNVSFSTASVVNEETLRAIDAEQQNARAGDAPTEPR
jgi:hypothetical protein